MKRLLIIAAILIGFALPSKAQSTGRITTLRTIPMAVDALANDTLTNADTALFTSTEISEYGDIVIKLAVTKVSGTVAGTAFIEGYDGTRWVTLNSDTLTAAASSYTISTATITNGSANYYWLLPADKAVYSKYRATDRSSGTNVHVPVATLYLYTRKRY